MEFPLTSSYSFGSRENLCILKQTSGAFDSENSLDVVACILTKSAYDCISASVPRREVGLFIFIRWKRVCRSTLPQLLVSDVYTLVKKLLQFKAGKFLRIF